MDARELYEYVKDVVDHDDLEKELACVRRILVGLHRYHLFSPEEHQRRVKKFDQMFKALLTEKARQERAQKIRNHNGGSTEHGSTGPTDHTAGSVGTRDILQEQIAGSGQ